MGEVKVTEEKDLIELKDNIIEAADFLNIASLSLRSCYVKNDSSEKNFIKLRNSVNNDAKVYSTKVLPFANVVVTYIQQFCENYTILTFDEFVEYIAELADEANQSVQLSKFTTELHKSILVEFKKKEDQATKVMEKLGLEATAFKKKEEELIKIAKTKYEWAVCLALIPVVGTIASPILNSMGNSAIRGATAAANESDIAVSASHAIQGPLTKSIGNFIEAMTKISGFFEVLTNELNMLAKDQHKEKLKRLHYLRIQAKANIIIDACRRYTSRIPSCETNLRAIPDVYDRNYVQEWLSNEQVEVEGKPISFLTWGRNMFSQDKQIVKLLAN